MVGSSLLLLVKLLLIHSLIILVSTFYDKEQKDWIGENGNLLVDTNYITQTLKINQEYKLTKLN